MVLSPVFYGFLFCLAGRIKVTVIILSIDDLESEIPMSTLVVVDMR